MTNKTMQELNKIEEELNILTLDRDGKKEAYLSKIGEAKEAVRNATTLISETKKGENVQAYTKAKQAKRDSEEIVQFYTEKLEALNGEKYLSEEEYKHISNRIHSEIAELTEDKKARSGELLRELSEIHGELNTVVGKANEMLFRLQRVIYKDNPHSPTNSTRGTEVLSWLKTIISQYGATQLIDNEGENE